MALDPDSDASLRDEPTVAARPGRQRTHSISQAPSESRAIPINPAGRELTPIPNTLNTLSTGGSDTSGLNEVLEVEEATRAHGFARAIALVCLGCAPATVFIGANLIARWCCLVALLTMAATSTYTAFKMRPSLGAKRYNRGLLRMHGLSLVAGVVFVEYYTGLFSPVSVVISLGIYYFAQSADRVYSRLLPALAIGGYLALALLIMSDVIDDVGLFPAGDTVMFARAFAVFAVTGVFLFAASLARLSRTALHEAINASREALLLAQQRAAQLAEANHQLDRALRVAVGKPGRHTGEIAANYTLGVIIGVGAIGEVYEASHVETGAPAAVKLLQVDAVERPDLIERFLREGAIVRLLDSPHVARVIAVGRLGSGAPYLAMELLRGRDLATRLRQEGRLPLKEVVRLAAHLGEALECAHAAGVVHRDLKPLNVYEADQPEGGTLYKVLDFGISKVESSTGTLTRQGVVGTPGYMSPEQARGAAVGHRSDVFSMAVVLYRALTGQPAFSGDSAPQVMFDIVYKSPQRPSDVARDVPREVDLVLAIALAKDPELRFQSASELAIALAAAARGALSSELKARGQSCARKQPWGKLLVDLPRPEARGGEGG